MSKWKVKKGSKSVQEIEILDRDGNRITNMSSTTEIKFQVKTKKTAATNLIAKVKTDMDIDTPSSGWLTITLDAGDTDIAVGRHVMGLLLDWGGDDKYETRIFIDNHETDVFEVEQPMIT